MMRGRRTAALVAGLCMAALSAEAQVTPDNFVGGRVSDLAALCAAGGSDPNVIAAANHCHGFMMAVGQFHAELTRTQGVVGPFFCLPDPRPSLATVSAGFASWAAANPQYAASSAVEGVVRYASATYPCPPAPPRQAGRTPRRAQ